MVLEEALRAPTEASLRSQVSGFKGSLEKTTAAIQELNRLLGELVHWDAVVENAPDRMTEGEIVREWATPKVATLEDEVAADVISLCEIADRGASIFRSIVSAHTCIKK